MRIVVKENFGRNLCMMLLEDIRIALQWLENHYIDTDIPHMRVSVKVVVLPPPPCSIGASLTALLYCPPHGAGTFSGKAFCVKDAKK